MFSSDSQYIMVFGILLALGFIISSVHYVNKLIAGDTKDLLVRFILIVFAALVGVFIVDKVIAFKVNLLSQEQNNSLFNKNINLNDIFILFWHTKRI